MVSYNQRPINYILGNSRKIYVFATNGDNIDKAVVESFGEEWLRFQYFTDEMIDMWAQDYFDIVDEKVISKESYVLDIGCGTGRWSKYLSSKVKFIEAIDPSDSIAAADNLLKNIDNVRLTKAGIESIPFDDESFDFVMCIGVLHHTPNPQKSMIDCVKKVKKGGHFYCYLYHNLESKDRFSKGIFWMGELIRKMVSGLPPKLKILTCEVLAIIIYMPLILAGRLLMKIGLKNLALKMPLSAYYNKPFFTIRNDSLDKFGTRLEYRFSKNEIEQMMINSGLEKIVISNKIPYYHAVGKKV